MPPGEVPPPPLPHRTLVLEVRFHRGGRLSVRGCCCPDGRTAGCQDGQNHHRVKNTQKNPTQNDTKIKESNNGKC